jgi:hypothetical protein
MASSEGPLKNHKSYTGSRGDVVVEPYNTGLAITKLQEYCDAVILLANDQICRATQEGNPTLDPVMSGPPTSRLTAYSTFNGVIAKFWLDMTSCMRHCSGEEDLYFGLTDIPHNLLPFPTLNLLCPAMGPVPGGPSVSRRFTSGGQSQSIEKV